MSWSARFPALSAYVAPAANMGIPFNKTSITSPRGPLEKHKTHGLDRFVQKTPVSHLVTTGTCIERVPPHPDLPTATQAQAIRPCLRSVRIPTFHVPLQAGKEKPALIIPRPTRNGSPCEVEWDCGLP